MSQMIASLRMVILTSDGAVWVDLLEIDRYKRRERERAMLFIEG